MLFRSVAWAWKAGGSGGGLSFWKDGTGYSTASAAGLTAGTITPTGASVNTKSGFSIITWTGNGSTVTIPHGLGKAPSLIISKNRTTGTTDWSVYHSSTGKDAYLALNKTNSSASLSNFWGSSTPDSTVFGVLTGRDDARNGDNIVAYCWAEIPGFSKFGSYTGNGSADGVFVNLNFRPRWLLIKRTDTTNSWVIYDSSRGIYNANDYRIYPDLSNAEGVNQGAGIDFLSNGFKIRSTGSWHNTSGDNYVYACFAEAPSINLYGAQANAR